MKIFHRSIAIAAVALIALGGLVAGSASAAGMPVFDATNYAQNLIQAARALDQINNQVRSLQNQASMLRNMDRNLERLGFPQLDQLSSAMRRIDSLMGEAKSIDFKVDGLDRKVRGLFPGELQRALAGDARVAAARARLDAAMDSYRRSMSVQAQVAENVGEDAGVLGEIAAASGGAAGALQAQQAANQLLALSVKQQLQLQQLMAAEFRDSALDRARRAQGEEEGRAATQAFLAVPASHTRSR
jgi:P-type conjugative transfer protein TrbJ